MSSATGVMQLAFTVRDLAVAKTFYGEVLGLQHLFDAPPGLSFYDCGGVRILLGTQGGAPGTGGTLAYLRVADLRGYAAQLCERGAAFGEAPRMIARLADREVWLAIVNDPDGNSIGLMEELPNHTG
jgi:methylmalonyl-CoA/ethylmalonyl-CoA epimerase